MWAHKVMLAAPSLWSKFGRLAISSWGRWLRRTIRAGKTGWVWYLFLHLSDHYDRSICLFFHLPDHYDRSICLFPHMSNHYHRSVYLFFHLPDHYHRSICLLPCLTDNYHCSVYLLFPLSDIVMIVLYVYPFICLINVLILYLSTY